MSNKYEKVNNNTCKREMNSIHELLVYLFYNKRYG